MQKRFFPLLSLLSLFSMLVNLFFPLFNLRYVYAQEVNAPDAISEESSAPAAIPQPDPTLAPSAVSEEAALSPVTVPDAETVVPFSSPVPSETPAVTQTGIPSPTPVSSPTPAPLPSDTPSSSPSASLSPALQETTSAQPLWQELEDKSFRTNAKVEVGREYQSAQNDKVKVKFNKLPSDSGFLTVKEIKLTPEQVTQTNALSDTAYEITSTMADGTFEYDLTLPLPEQAKNNGKEVRVKAAETEADLPNAAELSEPKEKAADTITIKGLNHFTVFIITIPSPDTTQRVLINEIAPTPALEWIELFNNGTQSVNLAAGGGWTLRNSAGNTQLLSGLGTIPAAGRVVFDAPAGWLSDTAPETITLLNELGTAVDTVTISLTAPGIAVDRYPLGSESVGRKTDGVAEWRIFTTPTKGTANLVPVSAGTGLADLGPIAPAGGLRAGFPVWYKDKNGLALDLMEAADGFGISDPVDPANPFSSQIGFNAEGFWWSADAGMDIRTGTDPVTGTPTFGRALLVLAMEAAFAGEAAVDGEQSAFARVRIRIDTPVAGTYVVTYPYGQKVYQADAGTRAINNTIDIGCFALPPTTVCDAAGFATALQGPIGPFLTWDTFNINPALSDPLLVNPANPSRRYVGNPSVSHQITGSQFERPGRPGVMANIFHIEGPSGSNLDGQGNDSIETELFTVSGRLADTGAPVVTLFGNNSVNTLQGLVYTDAGATCLDDLDGNCTGRMTITGLPVDTSTLGPKTITYSFTDSTGNSASVLRTVTVVAAPAVDTTPPVITLNGLASVDVVAGTAYTEQNAMASDDVDGNISANIIATSTVPAGPLTLGTGPFTVTYNVSDAAGNAATPIVRMVNVIADTVPPVVTVTPPTSVNILVGAQYTDAGATCTDNVAGNCTAGIVTTGLPIDTSVPGTHTITYSFTDAAGNTGTAQRTVAVANILPAGLVEVGSVAPAGGLRAGFPIWYKDSNGLALDLMEAADAFGISDPVDPANPFSSQIGFNAEGFWWSADADLATSGPNGAILVQAIEAAFAGEAAVDGEQSAFARVRIRVDVGEPGTYTVIFPFGIKVYTVTEVGPGFEINDSSDIGCFALPPATVCDAAGFATVLGGEIGPFLTWDTFNINTALSDPSLVNPANPGRRYVGNPQTPHAVTGSPTGNNFFKIEGPNIGGPGVNFVETNLFTVTGRLADITPPVITLNGEGPFSVTAGTVYIEPGATCSDDFDGNCTSGIAISSNVPIGNLTAGTGPFAVTYTATDRSGNTATVTRTVNVVSVPGVPVLSSVNIISNNVVNTLAKVGDVVTLTFTSSTLIQTPVVTIAGTPATVANTVGNIWTATQTLTVLNTEGVVPFTINFTSIEGIAGVAVSATNNGSSVTFDKSAPVIAEVTAVTTPTNDTTPDYTFSSTENGAITYGGDCSSPTTIAVPGNNTLTFNTLALGLHNNCTISVTDAAGNISSVLNVSSFTVESTAPVATATIAGKVFEDRNANRVQDAGEPPLSGWTVFLDTNNNGSLDAEETSAVTDASGNYQFLSLVAGSYNIREVVQTGWSIRLPGSGKYTQAVVGGDSIPGKDFGNTAFQTVGGKGKFAPIGGTTLTASVVSLGDSTVDVAAAGGVSSVVIPDGTTITESSGATFDASTLLISDPAGSILTGLGTGVAVKGKLQWGIPSLGLIFSNPITLNIFVGADLNGQTLNVLRSVTGTSNWTNDGIVAPAQCVVSSGICTFQATKASYYIASENVSSPTPTPSSSSSSSTSASSGGGSAPQAPACNDPYAGSAPKLLSAGAIGANEVTLTWEKAKDPVTHYVISYGLQAGNPLYGNPNVGGKDTTSYTVKDLSGGTTYYFRVRAGNGCNGGPYSNEIAATPEGEVISGIAEGFTEGVLGASTEDGTGTGSGEGINDKTGNVGIGGESDVLGQSVLSTTGDKSADQAKKSVAPWFGRTTVAVVGGLALLAGLAYYIRRKSASR